MIRNCKILDFDIPREDTQCDLATISFELNKPDFQPITIVITDKIKYRRILYKYLNNKKTDPIIIEITDEDNENIDIIRYRGRIDTIKFSDNSIYLTFSIIQTNIIKNDIFNLPK